MVKKLTLLCIAILVSILPIKALESDRQNDDTLDVVMQFIVKNNDDYSDKVNNLINNDKDKKDNERMQKKENVDPNTARVLNQYVQVAKQEALRQAAAKEEANKKANSRYYVDQNSDLSNKSVYVTTEDMNNIIRHFDPSGTSPFQGQGDIFIEASKESGLDPIYIFAHACVESGFGNSYLAKSRFNYFGINAVDVDPNQAYAMGSNMEEGIINGAAWIKKNYYAQGYTTLRQMKEAGYATSDTWVISILGVANNSIVLL